MQETLLAELSMARKVRMHCDIIDGLEELDADRDRNAAELAYHAGEAAILNR